MNFEKGSKEHPTGNLIVYSKVIGENPLEPGGKVLASNVVVSFLKTGENFPVVTFPPVSLSSWEELVKIISAHPEKYDIVKISDFYLPEGNEKSNDYIKQRMEQFNQLVMQYVDLCRKAENQAEPEKSGDVLSELARLSIEYTQSSGLAREANRLKVYSFADSFYTSYPQIDVDNFKKALSYPGDNGEQLISLYIRKFEAIMKEDYEVASDLKKKIISLESMI